MFRRRRRESEPAPVEDGPVEESAAVAAAAPDGGDDLPAEPPRPQGPWDVDDAPDEVRTAQRLDLGGISVPVVPGMELRVDMDASSKPVSATVVSGQSAMQVNAFAAPRTEGIWAEVRAEILASLQAGGAREAEGPWGPEVHSKVPAGPPVEGRGTPLIDARFIGVDGPRWFLRGLVSGPAATDPQQAAPFEDVLRGVVVTRGGEAMPPREPLPLVLPKEVQEAAAAQAQQQTQQRAAQERAQRQAQAQGRPQAQAQGQAGAPGQPAGAAAGAPQVAAGGQPPVPGQPPASAQPSTGGQAPAGGQPQGAGEAPAPAGGPRPAAAASGPRVSMADQLAAAARAVAARQAGTAPAPPAAAPPAPPAAAPPAPPAQAPDPLAPSPSPDAGGDGPDPEGPRDR